ncbi:nucleotidyltransferase substrate binding protein (TIGR01987 family) [Hypnocyclicus thermotrophus]|uniref:Nucleotidyltransferase substrate binding protein (TIGR01987 family) n=1 Tax=Hypnocyclicus thermotrophus TaxID=1627895 RepID=A0AA46I6I8_9FUSO|nr:HI0074 family nucleotidyltransferase substrate-binding subunit [Hypnocyclicus thermotrophus]TDT72387.1 nucleotidyltransferase substrate binding protein (TIGR01987 family) [Hypnocyclicus thermotrophus]
MYSQRYGLKTTVYNKMIDVFKKYPQIKQVKIFGSRVRGDYKENSDIDLSITFNESGDNIIYKVIEDLSLIDTILIFDVIDNDKIKNLMLWEYLEKEGEIIYKTNRQGEAIVDRVQLLKQLSNFNIAIDSLKQGIEVYKESQNDALILDGILKRFELCYEFAWRLIKSYLEYKGLDISNDPKISIKQGYKNDIIDNGDKWLEMLLDRNKIMYVSNSEIKIKIFYSIRDNYIYLLSSLYNKMDSLLNIKKNK